MKQSTQRNHPFTPETAASAASRGAAPVIRLRTDPSGKAGRADAPVYRDEAWPWDRCSIPSGPAADSRPSDLDTSTWPFSYGLYQEAQHRRMVFVGNLIAGAIRSLGAVIAKAYARYRQRQAARETYHALQQLDDRALKDLGFARDEIRSVAAEMSGEAGHSRRLARPTFPTRPSLFELMSRD